MLERVGALLLAAASKLVAIVANEFTEWIFVQAIQGAASMLELLANLREFAELALASVVSWCRGRPVRTNEYADYGWRPQMFHG